MKIKALLLLTLLSLTTPSFASSFEMIRVPKGQLTVFWLNPVSNKDIKPEELVLNINSFSAMKYPVQVKQYKEFLKNNPKWAKSAASSLFVDASYLRSFHMQSESAPVTEVSWFAASAFCQSYNMRLPTVNEWEYMAAASEVAADANKDEEFLRRILKWYGEPTAEKIPKVGSVYQNKYGLWDMHGLIWEWVHDFNSIFITGESREDSSFNKNMFCGAGAMSGGDKENYAAFMRFAFRSGLKGKSTVLNLGFRCVR